ncbi:MAG: type VI secretion system membrane subunit TssM [Polyangiales bacterium]
MWVWIVAALLLTATWVGGYFLSLPFWLEIALTLAVIVFVVVVIVVRRMRAVRAARALEREIMRQAQQQAANTRPDRRAEIVELQEQIQKGIASLKSSKLGNVSGAAALYALPWYVIIGPPGAGKTTALKHSGLEFPVLDKSGGGIRGVGGTRNCDWWFTNEAILLDTAGRYATEQDDHDEWIAFLGMLRKFREKKPINGVLVAISVADLAQATEEQIDTYAKKLRARIDEVMTRLEMVVPVYVMFTKADLIAGFVEFFGDLRKSERGQTFGATFDLDAPAGFDPARAFEREFDTLVETLHARGLRHIGTERVFDARQKIFQFPLEFQSLRSNLAEFLGALFQKNTFQETPIFRGVYFTSGTQEGRPMDRVLGAMARAFGLRPADAPTDAPKESKSYFVTDLFRKVAFPDQNVAARTSRESRRQRLRRIAYASAAVLIAAMLIFPSSCTYARNKDLVDSTRDIAGKAAVVKWDDGASIPEKARNITGIKSRLRQLDDWHQNGAPISMRWGMYAGNALYEPLRNEYLGILDRGLRAPTQRSIEDYLRSIDPTSARRPEIYNFAYEKLKLYLMMTDQAHLDTEWAAPKLTKAWAAALRKPDDKDSEDALRPHVDYYLDLMKRREVKPWKGEESLVTKTRGVLLQVPQLDREYEAMVRDANAEIPSITRETIFYGSIAPYVSGKKNVRVDGAYTRGGWARVRNLLEVQQSKLTAERWVLGEEALTSQVDVLKQIVKLRELYFERYKNAWRDFIMDLDVEKPDNAERALDEMSALSEPPWAYQRLLQTLDDNVTLDVGDGDDPSAAEQGLLDQASQAAKKKLSTKGVDAGGALDAPKATGKPKSPVELAFAPLSKFAVPPAGGKEGAPTAPTGLSQYQALIAKLVGVLSDVKDSKMPPDPKVLSGEFENAFRTTSALLTDQDGFTRPMLSPLLMNPITLAWGAVVHDASGAASGLWEVNVWNPYMKTLDKKYPFAPDSPVDAKLEDFTAFFKPKDGLVWGFYEAYLKNGLDEQGGTFIPSRRFKSAVDYSPAFLKCLKRTLEVTKASFVDPKGGAKPAVEFEINLHSVSENVSHVAIEIDGQGHEYKNEPEEWVKLQWPAEKPEAHGAKIRVRGFAGLDEEIARAGDFGFFRLLDAANDIKPAPNKAGEQPSLIAEWQLKTQSAVVRLNIRPLKADNAIEKKVFAGFNCPRLITSGK